MLVVTFLQTPDMDKHNAVCKYHTKSTLCTSSVWFNFFIKRQCSSESPGFLSLDLPLWESEEGFEDKRKWGRNLDWQTFPPAHSRPSANLQLLSAAAAVSSPLLDGELHTEWGESEFECSMSSQVSDSCWLRVVPIVILHCMYDNPAVSCRRNNTREPGGPWEKPVGLLL